MDSNGLDREVQQLRLEVIAIKKELERLKDIAVQERIAEEKTTLLEKQRLEQEQLQREKIEREERERQEKERQEKARKEREAKERLEKERKLREESERKLEMEAKEKAEQLQKRQREEASKTQSLSKSVKQVDEQQTRENLQKLEEERRQQQETEQEKLQSVPKSGLTAEQEVSQWVETVTGEPFGEKTLPEALKSGITLCNLINKLKPGTIKKINKSTMPFMMMENINAFLASAGSLGVPTADLFSTVDLYDKKNIPQVIVTLQSLGRMSRRIQGYTGPSIGPKMAEKRESHFTEEQLKKGLYTPTYGQAIQSDLQNYASAANKSGYRDVIKTNDTGTVNTGLNMFDKDKMTVQKDASSARKVGHNIIK